MPNDRPPTYAELSSIATALEDLTRRIGAIAGQSSADRDEETATELYSVERSLRGDAAGWAVSSHPSEPPRGDGGVDEAGREPRARGPEPVERQRSPAVPVTVDGSSVDVDWQQAKADLVADDFDNGRTPEALRASFEQSQHIAFARDGTRVIGMARLLSDGVCNAYLLDVWTLSAYRRQGVATAMVRHLMEQVPGQHIGLQADDARSFYEGLGFRPQPEFLSVVVGTWLDNDANPSGA